MITLLIYELYIPLSHADVNFQSLLLCLDHISSMNRVINVKKTNIEQGKTDVDNFQGLIQFKNVSLSDGDNKIFNQISINGKPGSLIQLTGLDEEQAVAIRNILFFQTKIDEGEINIDGQDLYSLSKESLRSLIGVIPDNPTIFSDTLQKNIGYSNTSALEEEIIRISKLVGLHRTVKTLPNGYDTVVGENENFVLTDYEKHKISLCRLLLKNPKIIYIRQNTINSLSDLSKDKLKILFREELKDKTVFIEYSTPLDFDIDEEILFKDGKVKGKNIPKN